MSESSSKKQRVIREDVKERHTNHWDLDYVSREELEQLMTRERSSSYKDAAGSEDSTAKATDKPQPVPKAQDQ